MMLPRRAGLKTCFKSRQAGFAARLDHIQVWTMVFN